ncbi:uncharacterized protein SOCE26_002700 [Sorangium cellulosum]|uniref:DSBA-like thioredoxin domain-containing protein n=1 Tax=Sorangium cellulosum TaxID=56 RepID=A0A2L0EHW9_SORCE|nr:DsbA family protein [Sorangium cellulosum]AUX38889.1 uncharacterized protein SOCE26_002700 [Sorangium cellulosum]
MPEVWPVAAALAPEERDPPADEALDRDAQAGSTTRSSRRPARSTTPRWSASRLGLDHFRRAMRSSEIEAAVAADDAEATRLKLGGTPTMFVNGRRIIGAQPAEAIRVVIDEALTAR